MTLRQNVYDNVRFPFQSLSYSVLLFSFYNGHRHLKITGSRRWFLYRFWKRYRNTTHLIRTDGELKLSPVHGTKPVTLHVSFYRILHEYVFRIWWRELSFCLGYIYDRKVVPRLSRDGWMSMYSVFVYEYQRTLTLTHQQSVVFNYLFDLIFSSSSVPPFTPKISVFRSSLPYFSGRSNVQVTYMFRRPLFSTSLGKEEWLVMFVTRFP